MAYSFPPRGFSATFDNQHFPPNFSWPPFPPPLQPSQALPRPPWENSAGTDRPPFPVRGPHFVFAPRVPGRFANLEPFARGSDVGPSERGVQPPGPRATEPGAVVPGRFPLQRPTAGREPRFQCSSDRPVAVDITECETWPGVMRRKHNFPSDGQHTRDMIKKEGPQNCTKHGPPAWKNQHGRPPKKTRRGKGSNTAKQASQLEHYCDVCDRGFQLRELLVKHLTEHVKCSHDGCKFEAHFKVVKLHAKMQHGAGSKRVAWLDTPAEVSKWREERKRNYPSLCNIAEKAEAVRSNEEKGVVLQNKYFGKLRRPNRGRQRRRNFQGNDGIDAKKARMDAVPNKEDITEENAESNQGSKSDTVTSSPTTHHQGVVTSNGHLGSLSALTAYGDSSEEEEGEIKDDTPKPEEATPPQKPPPSIRRNNGRRKPGWRGFKGNKMSRGVKTDRRRAKNREEELHLRLKKRPNLLEMLLASDIRKERNIILQCVRHVVQNGFLGVNETKETKQDMETRPPLGSGDSVKDETRVVTREMNGNPTSPDVSLEDLHSRESKEKTVEDAISVEGSEKTNIPDRDAAKKPDKQINLQEVQERVLLDGTNMEATQKDDGISNPESNTVDTYKEEKNDRTQKEVNSFPLSGYDVESGEVLVANERANNVQNGCSCENNLTDCNSNANVNRLESSTTSPGTEGTNVDKVPKLKLLSV